MEKPFKDTMVVDVRGRNSATNQGRTFNQARPFQKTNARGNGVAGNGGAQNRGGMINPGQAKPIKGKTVGTRALACEGEGAVMDEEQALFLAGEQGEQVDCPPPRLLEGEPSGNLCSPKKSDPEQIFWSIDDNSRKKAETLAPKPISSLTYECGKIRCIDLEADMSEVHDESKLISRLEKEYLNLQIWKPTSKLSDNSLNKTKQIWKPKDKLSDNSLSKTQRVWKATGKFFADNGYQWETTGKQLTLGNWIVVSNGGPTGKILIRGNMPVD
ncbi:hypothetical protein Tco_0006746 [Tanacetum coccineum]